ncbi:MAG: hypothetical protein QM493_10440 [Sulfurovum sp.]
MKTLYIGNGMYQIVKTDIRFRLYSGFNGEWSNKPHFSNEDINQIFEYISKSEMIDIKIIIAKYKELNYE